MNLLIFFDNFKQTLLFANDNKPSTICQALLPTFLSRLTVYESIFINLNIYLI